MIESQPMILRTRHGDVVTLAFNDPDHRNAMTAAMGEAFTATIADLAGDKSLRAVILTGRGTAFSAGGDLDMIQARADEAHASPVFARRGVRNFMRTFYGLFLSIRSLPCPTLAAINGHAIGAGLCVALGCDVRIAAREARLGLNFTKLGLHPGMGATWTLPRLVGPERAAELLYTSRLIDGEEAARIGLASRSLPATEVLSETLAVANEIASCAPVAVRGVKRALARSETASLDDQLDFESAEQSICFESEDMLEGIAAARERREPVFSGQ
jgi:enoyl-CoA hydratase